MRRLGWWFRGGCLAFLLLTLPTAAIADVLDPNFSAAMWSAAGSGGATGLAWAPDGSNRLFVTIKEGAVRVIENGSLQPAPFATETVHTNSECGVIGIAFDPDFAQNQYVYVFATVSSSEQQIIRYTANGNVGSERTVIMRDLPTAGNNHDGGAVGFGPDGKLYWAIGDLGNFTGVDADLSTLAAKVGRANRDGSVPNDNPFFDGDGPNNDWIWARGFRNPFTFTFQPATGLLWVNSVGTAWEQIFVVGAGQHAGYNDYENDQPAGFLAPVIAYRTNASLTSGVTAAARSGEVVTFTTADSLGLRPGMKVTVTDVNDPSFNADYYVASVPSATTFTAAHDDLDDATSSGGIVATLNIGGSITGGTFFDTSAAPLAYRGNFFFADYNTHRVERVTLANDDGITSVDHWATGITNATDVALGPDGALYMLQIDGTVHRASYIAAGQSLVVTPLHVRMDEAGRAAVSVRLASAPASGVVVSAALGDGSDPSLSLATGATLTFDAGNWATPQIVQLAAARDGDATDDTATVELSWAGLTSESVAVRVTDDYSVLLVLSTGTLQVYEGGSATFTVSLSNEPLEPLTVSVERASGSDSVTIAQGTQLTFTPANWATPQAVRIAAGQDADNADASAELRLISNGTPERTVEISVADDDAAAPVFTSTPPKAAVVGAPYRYDAEVTGRPQPTFSLLTRPDGMTIDAISGSIEWIPERAGEFEVAVRAANGVAPAAMQTFEIAVAEDRAPTCTITSPLAGDTVRGSRAEFYGDVMDDVRAVRAVFQIEGRDVYTDVNDDGHYHIGGAHNLFDTMRIPDGRRRLSLVGYDDKGQSCTASVEVTIDNRDVDDGGATDAATSGDGGTDGGVIDGESDSCSCRIASQGRRPTGGLLASTLVILALAWRRKRRAGLAQAGTGKNSSA